MKTAHFLLLPFFLSVLLPTFLLGQKKEVLQTHFHTLAVFREGPKKKQGGFLVDLKDSTILMSSESKLKLPYDPDMVQAIPVTSVEELRVLNRTSVGISAALGIVTGAVVGVLAKPNYADTNRSDYTPFFSEVGNATIMPAVYGLGGAVVGGVLGWAVGQSFKKSYTISGRQDLYEEYRPTLESYKMEKNKKNIFY